MAGYPNKIIINHGGGRGTAALIKHNFKVLKKLGKEVKKKGMLSETVDLRDKMKVLCADHYKSDMTYHEGLKSLIEETAERIDKKLGMP